MREMSLRHLIIVFVLLELAGLLSFWQLDTDATIAFSKDGCEVLHAMNVPSTVNGEENAPCRLEHARITIPSILDMDTYSVKYSGYEFDVPRNLVVWKEKNGVKWYR